jgi:hypothetical protein
MPISTVSQKGLDAPLSLTAPNLGTPSAINLANAVFPAGCVLQVVSNSNSTQFSTSSTSFVTTNFSASITPKSATSKIYVVSTMCWYGTGKVTVYRNSTNLGDSNFGFFSLNNTTAYELSTALSYLDSPATTSSTTYTIYTRAVSPYNMWLNINTTTATITLLEIAA